jgi:hypothetical protein
VAKIHTGYSGPATGKYYTAFVKEFNEEVDKLLKGGNNKVTETEKKANSASR